MQTLTTTRFGFTPATAQPQAQGNHADTDGGSSLD